MSVSTRPLQAAPDAFRWLATAVILILASLPSAAQEDDQAGETPSNDPPSTLTLAPSLGSPTLFPHHPAESALLWRHGDSLLGSLQEATDRHLLWLSNIHPEPLTLDRQAIERVDFSTDALLPLQGPDRLVTVQGDHLAGQWKGLEEGKIRFHGTLTGDLSLPLDHVRSIERLEGPDVFVSHPQALLVGPNPSSIRRRRIQAEGIVDPFLAQIRVDQNLWQLGPGGTVLSPAFGASLHGGGPLPPTGRLDLHVISGSPLRFDLQLRVPQFGVIFLESWDDELIVRHGAANFASAGSILTNTQDLRLSLDWNADTGEVVLSLEDRPSVRLLTDPLPVASGPVPASDPPPVAAWINLAKTAAGVLLGQPTRETRRTAPTVHWSHQCAGVSFQRFRITGPTGAPSLSQAPPGSVLVETADTAVAGQLHQADKDTIVLQLADGTHTEFPRSAILRLLRSPAANPAPTPPSPAPTVDVWFQDGQLLRGHLDPNESLHLLSPLMDDPVNISQGRSTLRALAFASPQVEQPELQRHQLDLLTHENTALLGKITFTGEPLPRFLPQGALEPIILDPSNPWTLLRAPLSEQPPRSADGLAHLANGESLPLDLIALEGVSVRIRSEISPQQTLPREALRAYQMFPPLASETPSIDAFAWRSLAPDVPSVTHQGDNILLPPGASIGHPHTGSDLSFTLFRHQGNAALRLRVFANPGEASDKGEEVSFLLAHYGNVYAGPEIDGRSGNFASNVNVDAQGNPVTVRLQIIQDKIVFSVNDTVCGEAPVPDNPAGSGLVMESIAIWGNAPGTVGIRDFSDGAGVDAIDPDAKRHALLLPRLLQNLPPQHLLVASNGDLLRGDVEAITETHFAFRNGLETFPVPRDRLAALVFLQPPPPAEADPAPTPAPASPTSAPFWLELQDGARLSLEMDSWESEFLRGQHPLLGQCRIVSDHLRRVSSQELVLTSDQEALLDWQWEPAPMPNLDTSGGAEAPLLGKPAPPFELETLADGSRSLKDFQGKILVLDFWATWCGPCVRSLPSLKETMAAFSNQPVGWLFINQGEPRARVEQFLSTRKLDLPVAFDSDQAVSRGYGVDAIPHSLVIDATGKVVHVQTGFHADAAAGLAEAIRKALPSAAAPEAPPAANIPTPDAG